MCVCVCVYVCVFPGEGQLIAVEFIPAAEKLELPFSVEARDVTAEHLVRFSPCNPHSVQQEKVVIRNNTYALNPWVFLFLEITFSIQVYLKILFDSCTKRAFS